MQTILVVDDHQPIRDNVCYALSQAGYDCIEATDGESALEIFWEKNPELVILDIEMPPGIDGIEVCKQIRSRSGTPIVFLSCRDEEIDRVIGLELGSDDYVTKPFSTRELVARVKNVLRRTTRLTDNQGTARGLLSRGKLSVDIDRYKAYWNNEEIVLTVTEFGMLQVMLSAELGVVVSRDDLMDGAYEHDNHVVSDRTIDSHIRRIRKKFSLKGINLIETSHGRGYKLTLEL